MRARGHSNQPHDRSSHPAPEQPELLEALRRLRSYRYLAATEDELQAQLAQALVQEGVAFAREHRLTAEDRVDFYLPRWRAAVEVKVDGSPAEVLRQLHRYSACADVACLVLVTRRARHGNLPSAIGAKPLHTCCLWEGSL